jgi:release factor glutamine methyltransferase
MTILEATRYSREQLKKIYDEGEAETISGWIIENITGIKKTDRISYSQKSFSTEQLSRLESTLQRLLTHEPVQYVLNESWFCGLKFYVDKNVLIPRPETEELVEWIITNCKFPVGELRILDIGSGSGCIPIALKRRLGKAAVWGCDISEQALAIARLNAGNLGADVNFVQLDFLSFNEREKLPMFDIIVSNPPYIPQKEREQMSKNVLDFEPSLALFVPDNDALMFYAAIADFGKQHLKADGNIYVEISENLGAATAALFQTNEYHTEIKKDMQGKDRMIRAKL